MIRGMDAASRAWHVITSVVTVLLLVNSIINTNIAVS
jgi:hypothetical protein